MPEEKLRDFVEQAEGFLKLLDRTEKYKKFCNDRLSESDKTLVDLDHMLELVRMDGAHMMRLISKRKRVLLERRSYKDELDRVTTILSKLSNVQQIHNQLSAVCTELKKVNQRLENRSYTPRVLCDDFKSVGAKIVDGKVITIE